MTKPVTEPCPFCDGTGRRLVAPPAQPGPGYQVRRNSGPTHGYESTYMAGCRCDLCRAARRAGSARRRAQGKAG